MKHVEVLAAGGNVLVDVVAAALVAFHGDVEVLTGAEEDVEVQEEEAVASSHDDEVAEFRNEVLVVEAAVHSLEVLEAGESHDEAPLVVEAAIHSFVALKVAAAFSGGGEVESRDEGLLVAAVHSLVEPEVSFHG